MGRLFAHDLCCGTCLSLTTCIVQFGHLPCYCASRCFLAKRHSVIREHLNQDSSPLFPKSTQTLVRARAYAYTDREKLTLVPRQPQGLTSRTDTHRHMPGSCAYAYAGQSAEERAPLLRVHSVVRVWFPFLAAFLFPANEGPCVPIRLVLDNPTGQSLRVRKFLEVTNPTTGEQVFSALDSRGALSIGNSPSCGSVEPFLSTSRECSLHASRHRTSIKLSDDSDFDGRPVNVPHPLPSALDVRRAQAFTVSTVFIYDFLVRQFV